MKHKAQRTTRVSKPLGLLVPLLCLMNIFLVLNLFSVLRFLKAGIELAARERCEPKSEGQNHKGWTWREKKR
jgi:hypothetical protein